MVIGRSPLSGQDFLPKMPSDVGRPVVLGRTGVDDPASLEPAEWRTPPSAHRNGSSSRAVRLRLDRSTTVELDRGCGSDRRRSSIPWGLAGMVGLILVIECWVCAELARLRDPVSLSWRFSAGGRRDPEHPAATSSASGTVWSSMGCSRPCSTAASGRRAVNLSAARGPTLLTYFLFRRARRRRPAVRRDPQRQTRRADRRTGLRRPSTGRKCSRSRESLELLSMTRRVPLMVSILVGRLLPSVRSRLEVRSNLLAALRGEPDPLHAINRVLWRNWTVNEGANVDRREFPFSRRGRSRGREAAAHQPSFMSTGPTPKPSSGS